MARYRFDDFQIGPQIGVGTVGTIYEVSHLETGERYALKLLQPAVCQDATVVSRFEREILVLEKLSHPNIVRYYGRGRKNGQLFYVMEYVEAGTLKELLAQGNGLSWEEVVECGRQMASALQHAHNHGIIHRDLKPGNIFLTKEGQIKLGDFGIALDLHAPQITDIGLTVGTYAYMCPELVRGERYVTGKVDLYALGCVLFEALTGQTPYVGENFAQIFEQHLHSDPPHARAFGVDCPERLDRLIRQLLAKDPENRPFNARAVEGVLNELSGEMTSPDPAHARDRAAAMVRPAAAVRAGQARLQERIRTQVSSEVRWWKVAAVLLGTVAIVLAGMLWQKS